MGTNFPLFSIYRNLDELLSNLYFDTARLIKKCIYNIQTLLREINNINASENEIYKTFIQCEGVEECLFRMENIYELVLEQCIELSQNEQQMQVYRTFRKALRKRAFGGGFGIDGYIKGQVTARIINTTTGGLHSWSYVKI